MAILTDTPHAPHQPPEPPTGPRKSPRALIAISAVVILAAIAAVAYAVTAGGNGKTTAVNNGSTPPSAVVTQPTAPAATTPSTVLGPSGDPANWPAAQSTAPSLASLYNSPPDLTAVVTTLQNYIDWAYTHPDPALVANYMLPESSTYSGAIRDLKYLKSNGWHARPDPTEVDFLKVTQQPVPAPLFNGKPRTIFGHPAYSSGLVVVVINIPGGPLMDSSGKVVKTYPPTGQVAYSWSLAQSTLDGRWRIADQRQLNPPGGIAALEKQ